MPKKLLLSVLISFVFTVPVRAQTQLAEDKPISPPSHETVPFFYVIGDFISSGKPVETDELAVEWALPQQASEESSHQESTLIAFIKAVGRMIASGTLVESDEMAPAYELPGKEQKSIHYLPEKQNNASDKSKPVNIAKQEEVSVQTTHQAEVSVKSRALAIENSSENNQTVVSDLVRAEQTKPIFSKKRSSIKRKRRYRSKRKGNPVKVNAVQPNQLVVPEKKFPEITVSTWQDQLSANSSIEEITTKALAGDAEAQYRLGMACYYGKSIVKDESKAYQWWLQSATQGYPKAMHIMGVAYRRGIGVPKHAEKALAWFIKAAQQGRAIDQYIVADVYYEGRVNHVMDDALAIYWATHAARQGHPGALVLLAQAKLEGRGIPPNIIHAYILSKKAAEFDRNAEVLVNEIEKAMPENQQKIAETVSFEDALKPISLASLLVNQGQTLKEDKHIDISPVLAK